MEKRMTRLLRVLEAEFALFWILVVAGCVLYETDVLPQGSMVGDAQAEYILQTVGILLTVFDTLVAAHVQPFADTLCPSVVLARSIGELPPLV